MLNVVPSRPNALLPQGFWFESLDSNQSLPVARPRASGSRHSSPVPREGEEEIAAAP